MKDVASQDSTGADRDRCRDNSRSDATRLRRLPTIQVVGSERLLSLAAFAMALATSFAVALWATRPSFGAEFGPIDDHEPLIWMGPDGRLGWSEFWKTLMHTEVGAWGGSGRFRPAYYVVRIVQTILFGDNPRAWYASVLVMFALACAFLGYTAATWVAAAASGMKPRIRWPTMLVAAAACPFLFAGMYAWSGIVGRLGPAELPGLLGISVALLSLTKLARGGGRVWWIPALLAVGTAMFAKESFVAFALVFPLVGMYRYRTLARDKVDFAAGLLGLLPVLLLALILGPDVVGRQQDVYGGAVGSSRLSGAVSSLSKPPLRQCLDAGATLLVAWVALTATISRRERRGALFLLGVIVWLLACAFFDAWFYGGQYPLPRYRAVVDLLTVLQYLGAGCLALVAVRRAWLLPFPVLAVATASLAASALFIFRLVGPSNDNIHLTREAASHNAAATVEYQHGLSETLDRLSRAQDPVVAVVATIGSDYEPAYAILNEVARRTNDDTREYLLVQPSERGSAALRTMTRFARRGSRPWHIRPVDELQREGGAVCVFLNRNPRPLHGCRRGAGVRVAAQGM